MVKLASPTKLACIHLPDRVGDALTHKYEVADIETNCLPEA
jgi:hypothetical protein